MRHDVVHRRADGKKVLNVCRENPARQLFSSEFGSTLKRLLGSVGCVRLLPQLRSQGQRLGGALGMAQVESPISYDFERESYFDVDKAGGVE